MEWSLEEAVAFYKKQGAPADQSALTSLLLEIQSNHGGGIPSCLVSSLAESLGTKESLILALIRRIPRLRLNDTHLLEICAGRNCGRYAALAAAAEKLADKYITVTYIPCQRQCGKGPNIRWDGTLYHRADEALLRKLTGK